MWEMVKKNYRVKSNSRNTRMMLKEFFVLFVFFKFPLEISYSGLEIHFSKSSYLNGTPVLYHEFIIRFNGKHKY